ncbi:unnamed protein product [Rangifer tarandus platyrhynchus]|uniref:Uncharacterized protein n=1 Tax=Rangifer tarandus platyrhynchus TaxID=3082113 RepID=A0ABN8YD86_RANTA|nr:unnamed protein product [Rangifer tarandus platyrhynchus]
MSSVGPASAGGRAVVPVGNAGAAPASLLSMLTVQERFYSTLLAVSGQFCTKITRSIGTELCAACGRDASDGTLPVDWGELPKDVWSSPEREVTLQGQTAMQTWR